MCSLLCLAFCCSVARSSVVFKMVPGKLLGLLVAIAVLAKVDGQCDDACQEDCSEKGKACYKHINDSSGITLSSFCSGYPAAASCISGFPSVCYGGDAGKAQFDYEFRLRNSIYYLYCSQAGGCESAMTCLNQLGSPLNLGTRLDRGLPTPAFPSSDVPDVCNKLTVFDCLETATSTCSLDQGGTTMVEVKTAFNDLCTNVLPQAQTVVSCQQFTTCLATFTDIPDISGLTQGNGGVPSAELVKKVTHYIASTTRTGFWCSWLQHNYQCAISNAQNCGLADSVKSLGEQKLGALKTACQGAATAPPPKDSYSNGATVVRATVYLFATAAMFLALIL